jgi:uncharacterized protein
MKKRCNDLNSYLRGIFGCRVQKITVDAGLTCPNRDGTIAVGGCIYCNSRGSGTGAYARGLSITAQLEAGKAAMTRRYRARKFIAYFQAFSNTHAPVAKLKALYDEALAVEDVVGLSIGTRPDCVSEAVLSLLQEYSRRHLIWVEYGLQSAVAATRARGLPVCAHLILGLPNETRADMRFTARVLAAADIDGVKLHSLYVVRGTRLEAQFKAGGYRCLKREEYADLVADVLERLPARVVIQRLTGDPHPDELSAPSWCQDKAGTLAAIRDTLEHRDTWQGRLCGNSRHELPAAS